MLARLSLARGAAAFPSGWTWAQALDGRTGASLALSGGLLFGKALPPAYLVGVRHPDLAEPLDFTPVRLRVSSRRTLRACRSLASCDARCSAEQQPCIMRAHHDRLLIAALARQGVLQPAEVVHRVADRRGAVSGRPTGRGTPSSKAILSFAKQAFPVKNFWKDRETLKIEIKINFPSRCSTPKAGTLFHQKT